MNRKAKSQYRESSKLPKKPALDEPGVVAAVAFEAEARRSRLNLLALEDEAVGVIAAVAFGVEARRSRLPALVDEEGVASAVALEEEARRWSLPAPEDEAGVVVAAVECEAEARRTTLNPSRWDDVPLVQCFSPTPAIDTLSTDHRSGFSSPLCFSSLFGGRRIREFV